MIKYCLFQLVNSVLNIVSTLVFGAVNPIQQSGKRDPLQLFEIAICNVVTAPIWHSIKLNAVGKLHLVFCVKSPNLLSALCLPPRFSQSISDFLPSSCEIDEFVCLRSFVERFAIAADSLPSSLDQVL